MSAANRPNRPSVASCNARILQQVERNRQHDEKDRNAGGDLAQGRLHAVCFLGAEEGLRAALNGADLVLLTVLHENCDDQEYRCDEENNSDNNFHNMPPSLV